MFPHCFLVSGAAETGSHGVAPQRSGEPGNTIPGAGGTKGGEQLMRRAVLTIGKHGKTIGQRYATMIGYMGCKDP